MFKIIWRVLTLLKNEKKIVFSLLFANLIFAILILIEPILYGKIIDTLVSFNTNTNLGFNDLLPIIFFWLGIGITLIIVKLFFSINADRLSHKEGLKNRMIFFKKIMDLSMKFHSNSNSGELVKKIVKGSENIFNSTLDIFRRIIYELFTMIILIPLVIYLNPKLGLFVVISGFLSAIFILSIGYKTTKMQDQVEGYYTKMSSLYSDSFSNISVIKSFGLKKFKINKLEKISNDSYKKQYPILTLWGILDSFSKILNTIIYLGVIIFGSYLFFKGESSIGEIVMFISFSTILLGLIENLMWVFQDFFWRLPAIKDFFEILDKKIDIKDKKGAKTLTKVEGNVKFEDVTFSYDNKRDVIKKVSLDIKPGEKVAFVGHTGSGKTTMTNLLLRFYEPQKGEITIDDKDISEVTQNSLRNNIGVIFQDTSLFNGTIKDNIILNKKKVSKKELEKVAIKSHSMEFIKSLPDGFDTIVGERGIKLSGGEKQRLSIARTLLKDAPILILDEATSALDAITEKFLQDSFEELMKGRTTFVIAHRLSTIRNVDRIFVFDKGEIIESGDYNTLVKKGGAFAKLVKSQVAGFID